MVTVILLIIRVVLLRFKNLAKTWPTVLVNVMGQDVSFKRSPQNLSWIPPGYVQKHFFGYELSWAC